jgi:hypothetical protein
MSAREAELIFNIESKPVSWAWRNPKLPAPPPVSIPWTKSSRDYWREKFANDIRNAQRERQDALQAIDWVSVRCGYG